MNKLKKILALATISLASTGSVSLADSSNFSGPFIGVGHSIAGIELKGQYIDPTMVDNTTNNGAVGMIGGFAQGTAGWGVPVGDMFHVVLGASYTPSGDAEFAAKQLSNSKEVTLKVSDLSELYMEVGMNVTENTALFFHYGQMDGDLDVTGNDVTNVVIGMSGETVSAGLKVVTDSGWYIKAEAGSTDYDQITISSILDGDDGSTASANADPSIAFGALSFGYQF